MFALRPAGPLRLGPAIGKGAHGALLIQKALVLLGLTRGAFTGDERHARLLRHWVDDAVEIEQIDAGKDDDEAAEQRHGGRRRGVEALEEQHRGEDGGGGEEDVVDRVDDVGRKLVERLVEVIHLCQDADDDDDGKAVVEGWLNWLLPAKVSLSATPRPLTLMTEMEPTKLQIEM